MVLTNIGDPAFPYRSEFMELNSLKIGGILRLFLNVCWAYIDSCNKFSVVQPRKRRYMEIVFQKIRTKVAQKRSQLTSDVFIFSITRSSLGRKPASLKYRNG